MDLGLQKRNQALDIRIRHHIGRGWRLHARESDPPRAQLRRKMELPATISAGVSLDRDRMRLHEMTITIDEGGRHAEHTERIE